MEGEDAGGGAGEEERGLRWVGEWMCVCVCGGGGRCVGVCKCLVGEVACIMLAITHYV